MAEITRKPGGQPGNDNTKGRRNAPTAPTLPGWHLAAKRDLAKSWRRLQGRNWGGTASAPNVYGMTVTVPEPGKDRNATQQHPVRATVGDRGVKYYTTVAAATAAVEAQFVRQENAKREARLAVHPFADPLREAALYRAIRNRESPQ